jgi:hypothetical protein
MATPPANWNLGVQPLPNSAVTSFSTPIGGGLAGQLGAQVNIPVSQSTMAHVGGSVSGYQFQGQVHPTGGSGFAGVTFRF